MTQEFQFSWQWDLVSAPEAIWPFAADTNRFNRDTGQPKVEVLDNVQGTKHLRMKLPIIRVEWEEEPFEWMYPYSFGVRRRYSKGSLDEMNVHVIFDRLPDGGTRLTYNTRITSSHFLALLAFPFAIGIVAKSRFEKAFRMYDRIANKRGSVIDIKRQRGLSFGGRSRFRSMSEALRPNVESNLIDSLEEFLDRLMTCPFSASVRLRWPIVGVRIVALCLKCFYVPRAQASLICHGIFFALRAAG